MVYNGHGWESKLSLSEPKVHVLSTFQSADNTYTNTEGSFSEKLTVNLKLLSPAFKVLCSLASTYLSELISQNSSLPDILFQTADWLFAFMHLALHLSSTLKL